VPENNGTQINDNITVHKASADFWHRVPDNALTRTFHPAIETSAAVFKVITADIDHIRIKPFAIKKRNCQLTKLLV
jgi:hypothetical protein